MNIESLNTVYFLGIGGIGMSALARYFRQAGKIVHGYDKTCTPLTIALADEGMVIHYTEDITLIPENTSLVVYTPAIPNDNSELAYIRQRGIPLFKRAQLLGELTKDRFTIAVAGTHGKTSITSMIAFLLHQAGLPVTAFIGGIALNFTSNLVTSSQSRYMIVEADEYDQSFLHLHPDIAVVSSMDADHLDIYQNLQKMQGSYQSFVNQIKKGGLLISHVGLSLTSPERIARYGISDDAEIWSNSVSYQSGEVLFSINRHGYPSQPVSWRIPGMYNIENALAAARVAIEMGIQPEVIAQGFANYLGVKRRFEFRIRKADIVFVDDYAHHPEEIRACIAAARDLFPGKRITGVFQPHLFSRTRDFLEEFAASLSLLDEVILMPIYPARELPLPGVTSGLLLDSIALNIKLLCEKEELINTILKLKPEVLLTLGAGDIDQMVEPIEKALNR